MIAEAATTAHPPSSPAGGVGGVLAAGGGSVSTASTPPRTVPLRVLNNEASRPAPSSPLTAHSSQSTSPSPHVLDTAPLPLPARTNRALLLDAYLGDDRSNLALCELFGISLGQLAAYIASPEAEATLDLSRRLAAHRAGHIAAHAHLKTLRTLADLASAAPHPGTSIEADARALNAHTRARDAARKSALALHKIAGGTANASLSVSDRQVSLAPTAPALHETHRRAAGEDSRSTDIDTPAPRGTLRKQHRRRSLAAAARKRPTKTRVATMVRRLFARAFNASLFCLLCVAAASAQCPLMFPGPVLEAGGLPNTPVVLDFNADGILDIAAVNQQDHGVAVFLGTGGGSFAPRVLYPSGQGPIALVAADFDQDGVQDLVTANNSEHTVSWLRAHADGSFEGPVPSATPHDSVAIAAADFNGDGRSDIAVTHGDFGDSVSILLGNGDGSFAPALEFATDVSPQSIAAADLNGDEVPDLAVGNYHGRSVSIFLGVGDGTFGERTDYETFVFQVGGVAIADTDRDGHPDLLAANSDGVWVFPGIGDGTFGEHREFDRDAGAHPSSLHVVDLNEDGYLDLAVTFADPGNHVSIMLGRPGGAFGDPAHFTVGMNPAAVASGDLNGDGTIDLAVADNWSDTISELCGRGDGTYVVARTEAPGSGARDAILADLNQDGILDVAAAGNGVTTLEGAGDGTFEDPVQHSAGGEPVGIVAADFDADGWIDLAMADDGGYPWTDGYVWVFLASGGGAFESPVRYGRGKGPSGLAFADFNGDGKLDLATANRTGKSVGVLLGDGAGAFGRRVDFAIVDHPRAVAAGDFNGDGVPDLAAGNFGEYGAGSTVSVMLGKGDGTFSAHREWATAQSPDRIITVDVNEDGRTDLVVSCESLDAGGIAVLLGNGDGTFADTQVFWAGFSCTALAAADIDHDGHLDLACLVKHGYSFAHHVLILFGTGDGSFGRPLSYGALPVPRAVMAGDLNADGRLDILAAGSYQGMSVLLQRDHCSAACRPDCDRNGVLDTADYFCFQSKWRAHDPYADYDHGGRFDVNDFLRFQNDFVHGCP